MSFQDAPLSTSCSSAPADQLRSSVSLQIFKINANVQGIRTLVEHIGTGRDSATLRGRLRDLTKATRALAKRASIDMKELANKLPQGPALRKIIADLDASLRHFQAAQRFSMQRQRTNMSLRIQIPQSTPAPLVDVSEPPSPTRTQTLIYATENAYRDASILDRQSAIREIQESMQQVAEMFCDIAVLVDEQGPEINVIEWNAARTASDVERGAEELRVAAQHQRRARRTCLRLILGVVCVVVIVAVLI
ncbi:t-SNARE [Mycena crocata]|nr:t-SNARE [Mycena crocata]